MNQLFCEDSMSTTYEMLRSYVSEKLFFEDKDRRRCRRLHDDVAVLDAASDFRILAARGFSEPIGTPLFSSLALPDADLARVDAFLKSDGTCLLLGVGKASILLFSAWYASCDLLLAVRVHQEEREVRALLDAAKSGAAIPVFSPEEPEETSLLLQLAEIFYYTEHILQDRGNFWTHCLTVANFVGCRLEQLRLPVSGVSLDEKDFHRITAFLVCLFLTMRARDGKIRATETGDTNAMLGMRISQRPYGLEDAVIPVSEHAIEGDVLPFLQIPAFRDFAAWQAGDAWMFDMTFRPSEREAEFLHAASVCRMVCLSLAVFMVEDPQP